MVRKLTGPELRDLLRRPMKRWSEAEHDAFAFTAGGPRRRAAVRQQRNRTLIAQGLPPYDPVAAAEQAVAAAIEEAVADAPPAPKRKPRR